MTLKRSAYTGPGGERQLDSPGVGGRDGTGVEGGLQRQLELPLVQILVLVVFNQMRTLMSERKRVSREQQLVLSESILILRRRVCKEEKGKLVKSPVPLAQAHDGNMSELCKGGHCAEQSFLFCLTAAIGRLGVRGAAARVASLRGGGARAGASSGPGRPGDYRGIALRREAVRALEGEHTLWCSCQRTMHVP